MLLVPHEDDNNNDERRRKSCMAAQAAAADWTALIIVRPNDGDACHSQMIIDTKANEETRDFTVLMCKCSCFMDTSRFHHRAYYLVQLGVTIMDSKYW